MKKIKSNLKNMLALIIGIIIASTTVYGSTILLQGSEVGYDNTNSGFKDSNDDDVEEVQTAIDELYAKTNSNSNRSCLSSYSKTDERTYEYKCLSSVVTEVKSITPHVGDYVQMTPTLTSYTTDTNMTGYSSTQTINPSELNIWRVIRVNDDGTYDAVSDKVSSINVYFGNNSTAAGSTKGYQNFVGYLNVLASKYENSKYTVGSRYMGYNGQTEFISDTSYFDGTSRKAGTSWTSSTSGTPTEEYLGRGDELYITDIDLVKAVYSNSLVAQKVGTMDATSYWLGSRRYIYSRSSVFQFYVRLISINGEISGSEMRNYVSGWHNNSRSYALRPIITLKSGFQASGLGTSDYPYVLQ